VSQLGIFRRVDRLDRRLRQLERFEGELPIGSVTGWLTATPPAGWLLCNGAAIPAEYGQLIALIGPNTPDMRGRVPMMVGVGGSSPGLGAQGGAFNHTHQVSAHSHGGDTGTTGSSHDHTSSSVSLNQASNTVATGGSNRLTGPDSHAHTITTSGSGHTHNIPSQASDNSGASNPPYHGLNFIVKAA
jgi:microcystin-dependent protein